jgi:hypothetical protein
MSIVNNCQSNITIFYKKNSSTHSSIKTSSSIDILTDGITIKKSSNLDLATSTNPFITYIKTPSQNIITVKSHIPTVGYYDITITNNIVNSITISNTFYPNITNVFDGLVINKAFSVEKDLFVRGNITAFSTNVPSDIRLKKDVINITDGLSIINKLRPVQFKWNKTNKDYIGFIAQEVEHILPNLVKEIEIDGGMIKVIKEDKLLPYLVDSIKNISNRLRKYESYESI